MQEIKLNNEKDTIEIRIDDSYTCLVHKTKYGIIVKVYNKHIGEISKMLLDEKYLDIMIDFLKQLKEGDGKGGR